MIPSRLITAWSRFAPWLTDEQVEQDLVLSRLIVEIANHPLLGEELVFRGGTCLHKLALPTPLRYSEDLDYVRATHGPIGPILDAMREIAEGLGMDTNTDVGSFPKVRLRAPFESGSGRMRVKIEINTYETSPARPHRRAPYRVESAWWSGAAEVLTFQPEELVATKLRALFQRKKGRDLFDLWVALTVLGLDPARSWCALARTGRTATPPSGPYTGSRNTSPTPPSERTSAHCCETCPRTTTSPPPPHSFATRSSTSCDWWSGAGSNRRPSEFQSDARTN
ncbi:hypothetical protein BH23ACT9_BH23ACT9_02170 [soil metagenome]